MAEALEGFPFGGFLDGFYNVDELIRDIFERFCNARYEIGGGVDQVILWDSHSLEKSVAASLADGQHTVLKLLMRNADGRIVALISMTGIQPLR